MNINELKSEIDFGLENLENIYKSIISFSQQEIEERIKVSALTYECLGYYNAKSLAIFLCFVNRSNKTSLPVGTETLGIRDDENLLV
ncbi:TPA: hypothetical protein DCX16_00570 [bacterium]|nr:hypothetical protein [bacterium]